MLINLMIFRTSGKCLSKQRVCDGQVGKYKKIYNNLKLKTVQYTSKADCEDKSDEQNCERMEQFYKDYRCFYRYLISGDFKLLTLPLMLLFN